MEFVSESTVSLEQALASDVQVARAAWVSNTTDAREKDAGNIEGLINFLYRNRHMSPFEHGSLTFYIETPIFVAREFMRHRTFSYNEMSGRYTELPPRFYVAHHERPLVQKGKVGAYTFEPGSEPQWYNMQSKTKQAYREAWDSYQAMLEVGIAREVARNVLPVGIMTQFYVTGNPRNWMQFLSLRNDSHALHEIRQVAIEIEDIFAQVMPLTHSAYVRYDWRDSEQRLAELERENAQLRSELAWAKPIGNPT